MKYKLSLILNVVLIVLLGFGAYKIVVVGSIEKSDDGRTAILLEAGERDFILAEMRVFLESVQGITAAIAENDMDAIIEIATPVGMASAGGVPAALFAKLPLEFKAKGMDTHGLFDGLVLEASDMGDPQAITAQLADLMLNCTSCHAGYRFEVAADGS